ncbi:hypothetical protein VTK56DRAFT_8054 [Thermocarpiscus australiensis]
MASFVQGLWESIFTPGPTPTLLVATNVTFATLQVLLACLLLATWSVHFMVLSVLCGGLWAAINWFARELKEHQRQEEEKARRALATQPSSATTDDSETEVERTKSTAGPRKTSGPASKPVATSSEVEPTEMQGKLNFRAAGEASSSSQGQRSSVSTEDEWEKVSENEKDK